jgi:hypothetical protein
MSNKGAEDGRQAPPPNQEKIPHKTAANGRGKNGRFNKGCQPGPGRPAKRRPLPTPDELVARAKALHAEHEAWKLILSTYPIAIATEITHEITAAGKQIPTWVRDEITRRQREET